MDESKEPLIDLDAWKQQAEKLSSYDDLFLSEETIMAMDVKPTEWLFPKFIPKPSLVALTGRPGSYKTFFAHWMARRLGAGKGLFDVYDVVDQFGPSDEIGREVRSAVVEEEMGLESVHERMKTLRHFGGDSARWMICAGFRLREAGLMDRLVRSVENLGIEFLILDPFTSVSGMEDENSNAEAREVMDAILGRLVNGGPKITVLFIHHPSKTAGGGDGIRGAGDILGKSYVHYAMEKIGGVGSRRIRVKCMKSRWIMCEDFEMEIVDQGQGLQFEYRGKIKEKDENQQSMGRPSEHQEIISAFKRLMKPGIGYFQTDMADLVGRNRVGDAFQGAVKMLKEDDTFYLEGGKWYQKVKEVEE